MHASSPEQDIYIGGGSDETRTKVHLSVWGFIEGSWGAGAMVTVLWDMSGWMGWGVSRLPHHSPVIITFTMLNPSSCQASVYTVRVIHTWMYLFVFMCI